MTPCKFFFTSDYWWFSLKFKWQQISSILLDSSKYLSQSQLCCCLNSLNSFSDFMFPSFFSRFLEIVPKAPTIIGTTVTFRFHYLFRPLVRSEYLHFLPYFFHPWECAGLYIIGHLFRLFLCDTFCACIFQDIVHSVQASNLSFLSFMQSESSTSSVKMLLVCSCLGWFFFFRDFITSHQWMFILKTRIHVCRYGLVFSRLLLPWMLF